MKYILRLLAKDTVAKEYGYESFEQFDDKSTFGYDHRTPEIIDKIAQKYHELMSEWVSVDERLPEDENNVFAILDGELCIMSYFSFQENGETNKFWGYVYDGIDGDAIYDDDYYPTHWKPILNQPLPIPPNKK